VKVLAEWGAHKEHVPALLALVAHADPAVRKEVIVLLGKLKDERAIDALVKRLPQLSDRAAASEALRGIGPAAEQAVLKLIKHPDVFTRREACSILADIGSAESLAALRVYAQGTDLGMQFAAEAAIKQIEARQSKP
jgi:HEAT repeat protein